MIKVALAARLPKMTVACRQSPRSRLLAFVPA
jgi:hypothetical protein